MLREFLLAFAYCLLAFLMLRVVFEMFETLREFLEYKSRPVVVLQYYLLVLPSAITTALPLSLFFGLLFSLVTLSKNNELLAMRAVGIGIPRACIPMILISVLAGVAMFCLTELLVPTSTEQADELINYEQARHKVDQNKIASVLSKIIKTNLTYVNHREGRTWRFGTFNPKTLSGENVIVEWKSPGHPRQTLNARYALWIGDRWVFQKVKLINYIAGSAGDDVTQKYVETWEQPGINDPPEDMILFDKKKPQFMTLTQLQRYLELHPKEELAPIRMNLHHRFAYPWACVVACLMAIPLGAGTGRRSSLMGVAVALGLFMAYSSLDYFCNQLGKKGAMDPVLAAWLGNGIFTLLGAIMIWRVR